MQNSGLLLVLLICLGSYGAMSAENFTAYMEDYLSQNQRQYDAKLKELNDEINLVRSTFSSGLRAISIQADLIEVKLEEVKARLDPIELIDSWQKQCVQNYSTSIPLIPTVLNTIKSCSSSAQSNLNSILSNAQNSYNSLQKYYSSNLKTLLTDCTKKNPDSLSNYTICIKKAIDTTNSYTISTQKNFKTYIQQAQCAADIRMNQAWECAFATVYSTGSTVGTALRLIDDCIANQLTCASVSCTTGCNNHMVLGMNERDFLNDTIRNPFIGLNSKMGCMELTFKNL